MTDKEQIIVDGVDVSGCKHYEKHSFYDCNETCEDNGAIVCTNCEDNPNCYYKQLAHKTKECKDLREALKEEVIYKRTYLKNLLDFKEKYEELKEYAQRQEIQRETYYKEFLKRNKALDKIEEFIKNRKCKYCSKYKDAFCPEWYGEECDMKNILDIINKTKEN